MLRRSVTVRSHWCVDATRLYTDRPSPGSSATRQWNTTNIINHTAYKDRRCFDTTTAGGAVPSATLIGRAVPVLLAALLSDWPINGIVCFTSLSSKCRPLPEISLLTVASSRQYVTIMLRSLLARAFITCSVISGG